MRDKAKFRTHIPMKDRPDTGLCGTWIWNEYIGRTPGAGPQAERRRPSYATCLACRAIWKRRRPGGGRT